MSVGFDRGTTVQLTQSLLVLVMFMATLGCLPCRSLDVAVVTARSIVCLHHWEMIVCRPLVTCSVIWWTVFLVSWALASCHFLPANNDIVVELTGLFWSWLKLDTHHCEDAAITLPWFLILVGFCRTCTVQVACLVWPGIGMQL